MRTGPMNGMNNIFCTATANQSCWAFVDSLVPELARLFIDFVFRENKIAREICREILEINANGCFCNCHVLPLFLVNPRMKFRQQRWVFMFLAFPLKSRAGELHGVSSSTDWVLATVGAGLHFDGDQAVRTHCGGVLPARQKS